MTTTKSMPNSNQPSKKLTKVKDTEIDDIFNSKFNSSNMKPTLINQVPEPSKAKKKKLNQAPSTPSPSISLVKDATPTSSSVQRIDHTKTQKLVQLKQKRSLEPSTSNVKRPKIESKEEFLGKTEKKQKFTEEGYRIYVLEDLISQKGGDTELCPFDCECCY